MAKLNAKFFVVTFLVSALNLFPPFLSQVAARGVAVEGERGGRAVAVEGPRGNVIIVGARVNTLPATASTVAVDGNTYYVDGDVYYQEDDSGDDVVYVVVPAPQ